MAQSSRHMLILTRPGCESAGRAFVDALCAAAASGLAAEAFEVRPIETFHPRCCEDFDLVIFDCGEGGDAHREFRAAADEFEQVATPVMTLLRGDAAAHGRSHAAAMIHADGPLDIAAAQIAAILERQPIIRQMRRELRIAQRFQGGLRGEISRIHEELQLAAMVQREFLPQTLPSLHGIEFDALWRPANYVSGDIYDIIRLDEDHLGVFIADAVGHGVPAALMTMVIARALPTKDVHGRTYRIVPPDEALRRLNREMILRQGDTTRFATAVYAVIDCRSRTMRLAGAGHPPPLLYRGAGPPRELETPGGLLGVFDDEHFDAIEVELAASDRVLFYSDGFEVAFPNEGDGSARSMKMPSRRFLDEFHEIASSQCPRQMIASIGRRLDAQPGSLHQNDDLTLICMRAAPLVAPTAKQSGRPEWSSANVSAEA